MRLLVFTQKIDKNDPVLGFFHRWIERISKSVDFLTVVCLEKGSYTLPDNVKVLSLGKEEGRSIIKYVRRFYRYLWSEKNNYETVFVHMNQEYVLLGGVIWRILGKKVLLWRNHPMGNLFTDFAFVLSNKVLYTSPFSYAARSGRADQMPVGIDTDLFRPMPGVEAKPNSILFLGRIAPIKNPDVFIDALKVLKDGGINFEASIYGDPLPKDESYYRFLKRKVESLKLSEDVKFYKGVPNYETPEIYNRHEIFVNLTPSGSMDKTIFEAAACGTVPIVTNKSLVGVVNSKVITESNPESVSNRVEYWLSASSEERGACVKTLQKYVSNEHSLNTLVSKLVSAFVG